MRPRKNSRVSGKLMQVHHCDVGQVSSDIGQLARTRLLVVCIVWFTLRTLCMAPNIHHYI